MAIDALQKNTPHESFRAFQPRLGGFFFFFDVQVFSLPGLIAIFSTRADGNPALNKRNANALCLLPAGHILTAFSPSPDLNCGGDEVRQPHVEANYSGKWKQRGQI